MGPEARTRDRAALPYDRSGHWPIDADGWQIVNMQRMLFPGGPWAYGAIAPGRVFYFGYSPEPLGDFYGPQIAVITNVGLASLKANADNVIRDYADLIDARSHIRKYILSYPRLFCREAISRVEFREGDGQLVDVF